MPSPTDKLFPLWEHKEEAIQFILDNFRFDLAHAVMVRLKHEWWDKETDSHYLPTIDQLKARLKELLDEPGFFGQQYNGNVCCGGFIIEGVPNWISVRFGYETFVFPTEDDYERELVGRIMNQSGMVTRLDIGEPRITANEFNPGDYAVTYGEIHSVGLYREDGEFKSYTKEEAEFLVKFLKAEHKRFFRFSFFT